MYMKFIWFMAGKTRKNTNKSKINRSGITMSYSEKNRRKDKFWPIQACMFICFKRSDKRVKCQKCQKTFKSPGV